MDSHQLLENLLQIDNELHRLGKQHRQLDFRLAALSSQRYPSGDEQLEESTLKKRKLQLKGPNGGHSPSASLGVSRLHVTHLTAGLVTALATLFASAPFFKLHAH